MPRYSHSFSLTCLKSCRLSYRIGLQGKKLEKSVQFKPIREQDFRKKEDDWLTSSHFDFRPIRKEDWCTKDADWWKPSFFDFRPISERIENRRWFHWLRKGRFFWKILQNIYDEYENEYETNVEYASCYSWTSCLFPYWK